MSDLKSQFLLDPSITFLNHGSFGATPAPVFASYQRWQRQLEMQPVEFLGRRHPELMRTARRALGAFVGAEENCVVYVPNATSGLNIVARSLALGAGDEVLSANHEYGALDRTWKFLAGKRGFRYINLALPQPFTTQKNLVDVFWAGVTPRTKVIFLSHITSPTALIFPVDEICARARDAGIITVVDGAHAPGQLPLNLGEMGVDFYSGNLHKWTCAPKGCAFLYARPELHSLVEPLVVSWGYDRRAEEASRGSQLVDYVEWVGTHDPAAYLAAPDAIRFLEENNWPAVRAQCHALASEAYARVVALTGMKNTLRPDDDDSWFGQLVAAPLPRGTNVAALKTRLYDDFRIEVPIIDWNGQQFVRVSIQAYNTREDVDKLVEALKIICKL
jgi:isopenicillin-N epimerase